jgi:hypothetical protein
MQSVLLVLVSSPLMILVNSTLLTFAVNSRATSFELSKVRQGS